MTKSSQVDQDLIRAIAELLNKENLAEIEIEQEDLRVRVTRTLRSSCSISISARFSLFSSSAMARIRS